MVSDILHTTKVTQKIIEFIESDSKEDCEYLSDLHRFTEAKGEKGI